MLPISLIIDTRKSCRIPSFDLVLYYVMICLMVCGFRPLQIENNSLLHMGKKCAHQPC